MNIYDHPIFQNIEYQVIFNAYLSVDTFFFLRDIVPFNTKILYLKYQTKF